MKGAQKKKAGQAPPAAPHAPLVLHPRRSVADVEEGCALSPKFGCDGLIPCVTTDADSGEVLMLGWMNEEALRRTVASGEVHYFSRSRGALWHKGARSGLIQRLVELRIDDDQDALWLRVRVEPGPNCAPASCHVGYRSCFYRRLDPERGVLQFVEERKVFDPPAVYGDAPNPTML